MSAYLFASDQAAAIALLTSGAPLRRNERQFLGGIAFDTTSLTEKQARWLDILLDRYEVRPTIPEPISATGAIH